MLFSALSVESGAVRRKGEAMNIRKAVDYSAMFAALEAVMDADLPQMKLYCEVGKIVCARSEKGAAVAAAEFLKEQYSDMTGFSPRNVRRMRDFYRLYGDMPELLAKTLCLNWTQNVVIMEVNEIIAPESIVACIRDFVTSIRNDWNTLSEPLAKALDQNPSFIEALLEQLDGLFAIEQP